MCSAGGAVRDRALHFRHAPRRLCRSSLAPAHQAGALSPFIDNPRRNASSQATPLLARGRPRSLPCLRLVAPVENRARLGFAMLAPCVFALPRCSCRMVSSRAYSSPVPQPASRHSIKPFSIQPIIANIHHSAVSTSQYRFAIWGRRCGECPFEYTPQRISRSESGFIVNVGYDDENNISDARVAARRDASPRQSDVARAGRLFAACRATEKTKDATRFRRVGIPTRNVRLDQIGTEWNRPRNRCCHLRFFRNFAAQRRS